LAGWQTAQYHADLIAMSVQQFVKLRDSSTYSCFMAVNTTKRYQKAEDKNNSKLTNLVSVGRHNNYMDWYPTDIGIVDINPAQGSVISAIFPQFSCEDTHVHMA
jgi:hypothetical protein